MWRCSFAVHCSVFEMGLGVDRVAKNLLCTTGRFLGFSSWESFAAGGVAATLAY
jgi:hypothetical protein